MEYLTLSNERLVEEYSKVKKLKKPYQRILQYYLGHVGEKPFKNCDELDVLNFLNERGINDSSWNV